MIKYISKKNIRSNFRIIFDLDGFDQDGFNRKVFDKMGSTEKELMNMDMIEIKNWLVEKNLKKQLEKIPILINTPLYV